MAKANKLAIKPRGKILPTMPSDVQVIEHGRDIHMYRITNTELETLTTCHHSLNLFLFSLCIGALMVFAITLLTVHLPDRTFAVFFALTPTSGLLALYFGLKVRGERQQMNRGIKQIKESREVST